ncbi:MAG: hypothetical protein D6776_09430 [Planctomycetota bacterium]|nr:MAG: hypothetical protein D6776_09430 [Planctomycetota bacterium]
MVAGETERQELIERLERAAQAGLGPDGPVLARTLAALLRGQQEILARLGRERSEADAGERRPAPATTGRPSAAPRPRRGLRIEQTIRVPPPGDEEPGAPPSAPSGADRFVSAPDRRAALERFPVEDMNRWLASGTVFQIRGEFAYLNLDAMGGQVMPFRDHIRNMGFGEQLGVLRGAPLQGRVLLFRREG